MVGPRTDESFGHLSLADQARPTIRWGREEGFGLRPVPPPRIPAIGAPYVPDENGHLMNEPALKYR